MIGKSTKVDFWEKRYWDYGKVEALFAAFGAMRGGCDFSDVTGATSEDEVFKLSQSMIGMAGGQDND